jgi:2-dehydropantoate 2-reductase
VAEGALRVAVLGAGAVGGLVGALLARTGDGVTFVAGGPTAEALRARGLSVRSRLLGDVEVAVGVAAELEHPVDACVVAVKAFDLDALAALALLTTHAGAPVGVVRTERRDDLVAAVREAANVARAEGAQVDPAATIAAVDAVPATMRSSMQRDAEEGRPLELNATGGSILRAAERSGVPAPVTARLVEALRDRHAPRHRRSTT